VGVKKCEKMQKYAQICENMYQNEYKMGKNGYFLSKKCFGTCANGRAVFYRRGR